jgi:precorrin-4/cobalt-precorrin-4 C11-methyltransferase
VLAHCPPGATLIDSRQLDLDQITEHLVRAHADGHDVARLCSGDPSIYSALTEQTRRLDDAGVPWDVTPGVPAYAAAAALLGLELTVPEVAQTVILTRTQAASTRMPPSESLSSLARSHATLALHLAIRRTRELAAELTEEYGADCPVAVVAEATAPGQVILRGTLADIADQVEAAGLRQAAIILVGEALRGPARVDLVESHLYGRRDRALPQGDRDLPQGDRELPQGDRELPQGDRDLPVTRGQALPHAGESTHRSHDEGGDGEPRDAQR